MADNPAGQNVLSRAGDLYAETANFHRTYLTDDDTRDYKKSRAALERTLTDGNVDLDLQITVMRLKFHSFKDAGSEPLSAKDREDLYKSTKKLIDTAMKMGADLAEYRALGVALGQPGSEAAAKTAELLNGGDLFASMDIPDDELRHTFRWTIVDKIVRFDYSDRQDFNNGMQRQTIQNIVDMETAQGGPGPIPRDIAEFNRQAAMANDYNRNGQLNLATEASSARNGLEKKIGREFRELFRSQVINGERSRGESLIWAKLIESPTIGPRPVPPAPTSQPATPTQEKTDTTVTQPEITPGAPAEPQNSDGKTDGQSPQTQTIVPEETATTPSQDGGATSGTESSTNTDENGQEKTQENFEESAPADAHREIDYSDIAINIKDDYEKNGYLTTGDMLDILGRGHDGNYDADSARDILGPFIKDNFGIDLENDIDPTDRDNTEKMQSLAIAAKLYDVFKGDPEKMKAALEASKDENTPEAELLASVRSSFGGALQGMQVEVAAIRAVSESGLQEPDQSETPEDSPVSAPDDNSLIETVVDPATMLISAALGAELIRGRINKSKQIVAETEAQAAENARILQEVANETLPERRKIGFDLEATYKEESKPVAPNPEQVSKTNSPAVEAKATTAVIAEKPAAITVHDEHVMPERAQLVEPEFHADTTKYLKEESERLIKEYEAIVKERKKVAELEAKLKEAREALPETSDQPLSREQKKLKKTVDRLEENFIIRDAELHLKEKKHENNLESHNRARAKHEERGRVLEADYESLRLKREDLGHRIEKHMQESLSMDNPTPEETARHEQKAKILDGERENLGIERLNLDARNTMHDGPAETLRPWQAPQHTDIKLGRGVGMGFGAWSLGHRLFGEAGQQDLKDERGTALTGIFADSTAIGADAVEIHRAGKIASAAQAQQPVAKAAARAALVAEETLEKTAQIASKVKTGSKLLTPVAIGATVVSSGVDFELGRRRGDAGRAAGAAGAATGGLATATGLAILGAKLGGLAGSFVVPGLGTVGGATIGAIAGGTIGALGGGYIGDKIARMTLTSRFSSWLGIDDELKKAAEAGFSPELVKRYDRTHDNKLDLDEIKEALRQNGIEALRDMDTNTDGLTNDELRRGLDGTLGLAKEQFQTASQILPPDPTVVPGGIKIEPRRK